MSLSRGYRERIRPMLDIIEKLRKLGLKDEGIKLPTIVVVGDQSSGKSSVLESLSGINLPRGKGLVTRVPLILRLKSAPTVDDNTRWEGVVAKVEPSEDEGEKQLVPHGISKLIIEYSKSTIKKEIKESEVESAVIAATAQLVGYKKDIKDDPITLTVVRAGSPELTLIDLPGITRVPIEDQPKNIYEQVTRMIRNYIEPEETVILNVISATVDFSTCESIRMSQEVDHTGDRTLAVVTKIDLAPDGLYDKIIENAVHVGLGYVLVRNRTEKEKTYEDARRAEEEFFETETSLADLADQGMLGVQALTNKLVEIQAERLSRTIPKLQQQLSDQLQARKGELASLPRGISSESEAGSMLCGLVAERKAVLHRLFIAGDYTEEPSKCFHAAAVMHLMFSEYQARLGSSKGNQASILNLHDHILGLMRSCLGTNLPDFLSMPVFRQLVKEQVGKNSEICFDIVPKVYKYAHDVASHVEGKVMESYPHLCAKVKALTTEVLADAKQRSSDFVTRLLEMESNMVTMNDASYVEAVPKARKKFPTTQLSPHNSHGSSFGICYGSPDESGGGANCTSPIESGGGEACISPYESRDWVPDRIMPCYEAAVPKARKKAPTLHRSRHSSDESTDWVTAREMQIRLYAYWPSVQQRLAEWVWMEAKYSIQQALLTTVDHCALQLPGLDRQKILSLMHETPAVHRKRESLIRRIQMLKKGNELVETLSELSSVLSPLSV